MASITRYRLNVWVDVPNYEENDPEGEAYEYTPRGIEKMLIAALRRLEFTSDVEMMDSAVVEEE